MIIQTAPAGTPRLAIMMYEHTALCGQFARAFGNEVFEPLAPLELMVYIISHHDAGWAEFDHDPPTDAKTSLPYNLIETPAEYITVTSRLSPDFNERQHPFCGLLSSMHSWGLYNGRYGLSKHVLIKQFPETERPLAERMLDGELARQRRLDEEGGSGQRSESGLPASTRKSCFRTISSCNSSTRWRFTSIASIRASAARRPSSMCHAPPKTMLR